MRRSKSSAGARSPVISGSVVARSPPAQKARSPAPVRMATRSCASARKSTKASASRHSMRGVSALRASGRSSVMVATWPCFS